MKNYLTDIQTLTGVIAADIAAHMGKDFPPEALKAIPYGPMAGKTDIRFNYVRDRFDEVFGPHGIGWRITPHERLGKVECRSEEREKLDKKTGEIKQTVWYTVVYTAHVFEYAVQDGEGVVWIATSPMSDSDENVDEGYAYRGAFTSLLKQVLRGFGGMNQILTGTQTHNTAQRQPSRPAPQKPADVPPPADDDPEPIHWSADAAVVKTLVDQASKKYGVTSLADMEAIVGEVSVKFASRGAFGQAFKDAYEKETANATPAKPKSAKHWSKDAAQVSARDEFLMSWGKKSPSVLADLEGSPKWEDFNTFEDMQKAVRATALAALWPFVFEKCRVVITPLGHGVVHFDSALGDLVFYSRAKFEAVMKEHSADPTLWDGVSEWKAGEHVLPEMIVVVPKWVEKEGTEGHLEIERFAAMHSSEF